MLSFNFADFIAAGGVSGHERRAAAQAVQRDREFWLRALESYRATLTDDTCLTVVVIVDGEIRRLRHPLGQPAPVLAETLERRRRQTRERVRRFCQRQKAAEAS